MLRRVYFFTITSGASPASASQPPASGQHWQPPCVIVKKYTRRSMAEAPVIFTCTFYTSEADVRLACCLKFLGQCRAHELDVVVVDASPSEAIRAKMKEAHPAAEVVKQTAQGRADLFRDTYPVEQYPVE